MLALHFWELLARVPPHHDIEIRIDGYDWLEFNVVGFRQEAAGQWVIDTDDRCSAYEVVIADEVLSDEVADIVKDSLAGLPGNLSKLTALEIKHVYAACLGNQSEE